MSRKRIWVVAAGTGGHIIPGLEIARKLEQALVTAAVSSDFIFWGTRDRLEAKLVPAANRKLKFVVAKPWKGLGLLGKIKGLVSLLFSVWPPIWDLLIYGRPHAVVSLGGYVSFPVVAVGLLFRVPVFVHEPNIKTGVATRLLGKYARFVTTVPGSDANQLFVGKVYDAGNPVPLGFEVVPIRSSVKTLVVLGGSQGARSLCQASLEVFKEMLEWDKTLNLILQAGMANVEMAEALQKKLGIEKRSRIYGFVKDMPKLLGAADIAIARAGAMTLSELSLVGLPTVLVPFPHAADDHQRVNAALLERAGAVRMIEEGEGFERRLSAVLRDMILSEKSLKMRLGMSEAFKKFGRPHAGEDIAQKILSNLGVGV